jgi:predicted nucleotidyltransferase
MLNIEDKIENLIKYFRMRSNIVAVWIIGSYGTEHQREESDIDFAILFDKEIKILEEMSIAGDITEILNEENIEIVNLNKRTPITLQFRTIKEGRILYESDYIQVCDYIEQVIKQYQNSRYYIETFNKDYFGIFKI